MGIEQSTHTQGVIIKLVISYHIKGLNQRQSCQKTKTPETSLKGEDVIVLLLLSTNQEPAFLAAELL